MKVKISNPGPNMPESMQGVRYVRVYGIQYYYYNKTTGRKGYLRFDSTRLAAVEVNCLRLYAGWETELATSSYLLPKLAMTRSPCHANGGVSPAQQACNIPEREVSDIMYCNSD